MCVPLDPAPPIAQISGTSVNTKNLILISADGAEFSVFEANSGVPGSTRVVILPDVRGLVPLLRGTSRRIR